MLLYHLIVGPSKPTGIEKIKAEGLVPGPECWNDWHSMLRRPPEGDVVWLTTNPNDIFRPDQPPNYRIKVRLPSTDRKLVKITSLVRKEAVAWFKETDLGFGEPHAPLHWWVHFGIIPPERFVGIFDEVVAQTPAPAE